MRAYLCLARSVRVLGPAHRRDAGTITLAITSPTPGDELVASSSRRSRSPARSRRRIRSFGVLQAWVNGAAVDVDDERRVHDELVPVGRHQPHPGRGGDGVGTVVSKQLDVMWAPTTCRRRRAPPRSTCPMRSSSTSASGSSTAACSARRSTCRPIRWSRTTSASALELILWNIDLASLLGGGIHVGTRQLVARHHDPVGDAGGDHRRRDRGRRLRARSVDRSRRRVPRDDRHVPVRHPDLVDRRRHLGRHARLGATSRSRSSPTARSTSRSRDVTAVVGPLVPQFTGPDGNTLDGFITVGNNDFRTLVENLIQQQLIPTFTDRIPPLLEQLLGATDKLLDNVSFTLDSKLGTPVTLTLDGTVGGARRRPGAGDRRRARSRHRAPGRLDHDRGHGAGPPDLARRAARLGDAALPATPASALERRAVGGLAQRDAALAVELAACSTAARRSAGCRRPSARSCRRSSIPTPDGSDVHDRRRALRPAAPARPDRGPAARLRTRRSRSRRPPVRASSSTARRSRSRSSRRPRSSCGRPRRSRAA